jgi:hypothetical protein
MSVKRLGQLTCLLAAGAISGCSGTHWVGGNPNAPFAPPPAETKTSTVAAAEASQQHPVANESAPISSPKPVEVEATTVAAPAPSTIPAPAPAPGVAPAAVAVRPILPVAKQQVKLAVHPLDVPAEVQGNFARDFPGSDIKQVIKKTDGEGHATYWFKFDDLSYHEHYATYSDSGNQLWEKQPDFWTDFFKYDQRPWQNRYTQGSLD